MTNKDIEALVRIILVAKAHHAKYPKGNIFITIEDGIADYCVGCNPQFDRCDFYDDCARGQE